MVCSPIMKLYVLSQILFTKPDRELFAGSGSSGCSLDLAPRCGFHNEGLRGLRSRLTASPDQGRADPLRKRTACPVKERDSAWTETSEGIRNPSVLVGASDSVPVAAETVCWIVAWGNAAEEDGWWTTVAGSALQKVRCAASRIGDEREAMISIASATSVPKSIKQTSGVLP